MAASDPDQSSVCFAELFKAKLPIVSLFPKPTERRGLGPFQPQGTGNLPVTTGYYCHISRGFSDRLSAWRAPMCIFYRMHIEARLFAVRKAALFFDSFPHENFVLMGALFDLIACGRQSLPACPTKFPILRGPRKLNRFSRRMSGKIIAPDFRRGAEAPFGDYRMQSTDNAFPLRGRCRACPTDEVLCAEGTRACGAA